MANLYFLAIFAPILWVLLPKIVKNAGVEFSGI
jgi:hypothetical protein